MKMFRTLLTTMSVALMVLNAAPAMAFELVPAAQATSTDTITVNDTGLDQAAAIGLGSTDIRVTIARIIKVAMGLLGIVAVVIVLVGGFTWMTAGGNDEKVGEAKKWIFAGVIGLAIIFSAYALASFVINSLVTATTQPDITG